MSDTHVVCSQELSPCLPAPDIHATPIPAPCIVTLSDPLEATLPRSIPLNLLPSADKAALTLPTRSSMLTDTIRLPARPGPTLHRTLLSDVHPVSSQDVWPTRPPTAVCPPNPSPAPEIVTLADPVPPRFACPTTLMPARSTDCATVVLPAFFPALTTSRPLPLVTSPIKLTAHVSDSHLVTSTAVPDRRAAAVYMATPRPTPKTVTSCDPVPAALDGVTPLNTGPPSEKPSLALPNAAPPETETRRLHAAPSPAWHRTDVSDSHLLRSHDVPCISTCQLASACPIAAPNTVTLADPVDATFATFNTLTVPPVAEYPAVALPSRAPALNVVRALLPSPCTPRPRTDESDPHVVSSQALLPCAIPPDTHEPPIPDPYTVTLADPELPALTRLTTLSDGQSPDTACEALRPTTPTLSDCRKLPIKPWPPTSDTTVVSDTQLVPSHPVPPCLPRPEYAASPTPAPPTVTLDDPVTPRLTATTVLSIAAPVENTSVPLPPRAPAVTDTRPLRHAPPAPKPRIALSDTHTVPSAALCPILLPTVISQAPYPAPYSVSDSDPVLALFTRPESLTDPACIESAHDTLPTSNPAVICTRRLPPAPAPATPRTELSDSHVVASHPVLPSRTPAVLDHSPRLAPTIVTLLDPVTAAFPRFIALIPPDCTEYTTLALHARLPTLTTVCRLPTPTAPAPKLRTDVSDSHVVRSDALDPCLSISVYDAAPSPDPCTVALDDPVAAPFLRPAALSSQPPTENPLLPLHTRSPTVAAVLRLPAPPCPALHRVDVSDSHNVPSHADAPTRSHPLYPAAPTLAPRKVKSADPVPAMFVRPNELADPTANDKPPVKLPPSAPAVTTTRSLPFCPPPSLHATLLSDAHTVPSHPVPAARTAPECAP